jgi:DNA-binding XRE family transcriptional regulator
MRKAPLRVKGTYGIMSAVNQVDLMSLRQDAGLTQVELARRLGVTDHTIRNWEKSRTLPEHEHVIALARELRKPLRVIYSSMGFDVSDIPFDVETQNA